MFQGLFGWLRSSVRAAVIGGVQDAVNDLVLAQPADDVPAPVLRLTFAPAKEEETTPAKKRRAE